MKQPQREKKMYFGKIEPIQLWMEIVKRFKDEVLKEVVHPLIATYSKRTCDREYLEGNNYVCVNVKVGCDRHKEIFAVDIYPSDHNDEVVFSLFRRKYRNSLYKMVKGTEDENSASDQMIGNMVKESSFNGF